MNQSQAAGQRGLGVDQLNNPNLLEQMKRVEGVHHIYIYLLAGWLLYSVKSHLSKVKECVDIGVGDE